MKLSKSVLLSIALFGASASIFSYAAAVYDVRGDDANALGNQFKSYLARAVNGDEIVLHNNVNLLRETGKLDIPNITIRSTNNSRLHIVGANLNLTGSAKFKDLNLSLRPDVGLNAAFSGLDASGPDAMPTFIITNGNSLTLDNVTTNVDGDNKGVIRPIILAGGGNSAEPEILTITNSKNESKFHSIIVDSTKKLNDAGNNFANNDSRSEKEITINLDANSRVLNELNLAGIDKSQSPNNKISINSETLNIGNFGNSSKDGIRIGGAKNVNLTFSNVKNNLKEVKFVDDANINLKTLVLDGAEIVLKKDTNIGTLELKNGAKFNVDPTPSPDPDEDNTPHNVTVDTLKTDGKTNTLDIEGGSSIRVTNVEGDTSGLTVAGGKDNLHFAASETHDYDSEKGTFTPKQKEEEESSTSETGGGRPETGLDNTNGTGTGPAAGGDQTGGDATVGDQAGGSGEDTGSDVDTEVDQDEENQGGTGTNTGDSSTPNGTGDSTSTTTTPTGTGTGTPEASNTDGGGKQDGTEAAAGVENGAVKPSKETSEDGVTDTSGQQPPTNKPTEPSKESTTTTNPKDTETDAGEKEGSTEGGVVPKPSEGNAANGGDPVAPTVQPGSEQNPPSEEGNKEEEETGPKTDTPAAGNSDSSVGAGTTPLNSNSGNQTPPKTEGEEQPAVTDPNVPATPETTVPKDPSISGSDKGENDPAVTPPNANNNGGSAGSDDELQGDDPNANGEPADTGANNNADATKPVTPAQPSEKPAAKPAETPKEKPTEKSIKDSIIDALKGLFIGNNLDKKQQQQVVEVAEKTEESLKDLASAYADYDFIFSLDAARVTENRLNDLSMLNGLESASIDNYAFLAQSARALKARNSVWVSTSIGQQRGDSKRRSHSINLGYDEQFGNLLFGTFVSYLHQKGERGELSSKLHGYAFNIYAKYNQDAHEVIGLLNVGRSKAHLQRNISALGVSNQADAKGKFVGLRVEYGYRMPFEQYGLQIKPLVGLSYNLGRQAAFTEHGTVMAVHVGKIKAQRLSLEAGVELKKYFETAYIYAKPMIQTDLMARSNDVDVRFVDTPNSIPFKSATKKKTYFALSLGTQVQLRKNLLLDVNANSRIGNNERDIQGSVKLGYKF